MVLAQPYQKQHIVAAWEAALLVLGKSSGLCHHPIIYCTFYNVSVNKTVKGVLVLYTTPKQRGN